MKSPFRSIELNTSDVLSVVTKLSPKSEGCDQPGYSIADNDNEYPAAPRSYIMHGYMSIGHDDYLALGAINLAIL